VYVYLVCVWGGVSTTNLDVQPSLCAGLDKVDVELPCLLIPVLNGDLSAMDSPCVCNQQVRRGVGRKPN
jgi:hypothetical protein